LTFSPEFGIIVSER